MTEIQNRPWLENYPNGVLKEIDSGRFSSLAQLVEETCKKFGPKTAFSNLGHEMSFDEVEELSRQFAAFLQGGLGLKKGDRLIIQMPNLLQYPVALFGALRAGVVVVNVNPLYTPHEMEKTFIDSGATAILILENFAEKLEQVLPKTQIKTVIITEIGDLFPFPKRVLTNFAVKHIKKMVPAHTLSGEIRFREAMVIGSRATFRPPELGLEDLAFLQYTGGTTGVSKAAMLSNKNVISNTLQMLEWMKPKLNEGEEVAIAALPLYHIFCLTVNCLGLFHYGSHNVLITNPKDIPAFLKTIHSVRPSIMTVVSTLAAALMNHPKFSELDFETLKVTVAGGMALKSSVAEEWKRRTWTSVIEGYGLTEASPVVSCNPLDGRDRLGTIGMPVPSTEVKVVDESGGELGFDQPGELCVRGAQVMRGYWNNPDETSKVLDADGWLHTGDIALMEKDGFLRIVDRKKDMILVSGFNVYPNEVEEVVMSHPKVLEAAAVGVADEHSGEVVKLVLVKRDSTLTEEEIQKHCHENLAAYKCPKHIEFRAELPKTNVGKILRRELR